MSEVALANAFCGGHYRTMVADHAIHQADEFMLSIQQIMCGQFPVFPGACSYEWQKSESKEADSKKISHH
jgi:hypothetical protein